MRIGLQGADKGQEMGQREARQMALLLLLQDNSLPEQLCMQPALRGLQGLPCKPLCVMNALFNQ